MLCTASVNASALDIVELFSKFEKVTESEAEFTETWTAGYLDESVVTSGKLVYRKSGGLSKIIEQPAYSELIINDDSLTIVRHDKSRVIRLSDQPALAAGIHAIRDVLEGDIDSLKKNFAVEYGYQNGNWQLALQPIEAKVRERISRISLQGYHHRIDQISVHYKNGDEILTEIVHD